MTDRSPGPGSCSVNTEVLESPTNDLNYRRRQQGTIMTDVQSVMSRTGKEYDNQEPSFISKHCLLSQTSDTYLLL
jgi:hypothetical protein